MIAARHYEAQRPRPRTARNATHARRAKATRARYAGFFRFCAVLGAVLAGVMAYMVLMTNLTGLNYRLAQARAQRAGLQAQSLRLDDRIARLRSDDRLAAIAARLGMHPPQEYALVRLPAAQQKQHPQVALLTSLADFFGARR